MGMIATGSHSFSINKLTVPGNRHFIIEPGFATLPDLIYKYPFLQFAETTLAINSSGMAIRFLELAEEILEQKKAAKRILLMQRKKLDTARQFFYKVVS